MTESVEKLAKQLTAGLTSTSETMGQASEATDEREATEKSNDSKETEDTLPDSLQVTESSKKASSTKETVEQCIKRLNDIENPTGLQTDFRKLLIGLEKEIEEHRNWVREVRLARAKIESVLGLLAEGYLDEKSRSATQDSRACAKWTERLKYSLRMGFLLSESEFKIVDAREVFIGQLLKTRNYVCEKFWEAEEAGQEYGFVL